MSTTNNTILVLTLVFITVTNCHRHPYPPYPKAISVIFSHPFPDLFWVREKDRLLWRAKGLTKRASSAAWLFHSFSLLGDWNVLHLGCSQALFMFFLASIVPALHLTPDRLLRWQFSFIYDLCVILYIILLKTVYCILYTHAFAWVSIRRTTEPPIFVMGRPTGMRHRSLFQLRLKQAGFACWLRRLLLMLPFPQANGEPCWVAVHMYDVTAKWPFSTSCR